MNQKYIYISISVILLITTASLVGWSFFISQKQKELNKQNVTDVFSSQNRNAPFGGALSGVANTVADLINGADTATEKNLNLVDVQEHYTLPSSGATFYATSTIRFVERSTGHVFERSLVSGETVRIEQTTIPRVHEAFFVQGGNGVIRRFIDETNTIITTYMNLAPAEDTVPDLVYLPDNLKSMAVSPDGEWIAAVHITQQGSEVITMRVDGSEPQPWFSSSLRGFTIQWVANTLVLTQAPSATAVGSVITIALPKGTVTTLIRQKQGLESLMSPDGTLILFSSLDDENLPSLTLYNLKNNSEQELYIRGVATKCAWSLDSTRFWCALPTSIAPGEFPDAYYQGEIHTSDTLWEMDIDSQVLYEVVRFSSFTNTPLDAQNLIVHPEKNMLLFRNGSNQTLWSVVIPHNEEVQ